MNRKIKKAVFPVAGFGTRFLPATKAMPKELLPIIDKPLIQYAVEEAITAGIDTLIFITGRNKRAIEDHFDANYELESALRTKNKHKQAEMVRNILPKGVECIFIRQAEALGLGHAVLCARRVVGKEPFAVLLADDFISYESDGVISHLLNAFERSGKSQLSAMAINGPEISQYGVLEMDKPLEKVTGIIEKPKYNDAPSNLASIGRYIFTPDIFDILENQKPEANGEIQLTGAINEQAKLGQVEKVMLNGTRFDCGSVSGYLSAIKYSAEKLDLK
jgi:UTP--glucose-1-phosphate uridylyltransferase